MARGKAGWEKLKPIAGFEEIDVFRNKATGTFGTRLGYVAGSDVVTHETLQDVEHYVWSMVRHAYCFAAEYSHDRMFRVQTMRIRKVRDRWYFVDGNPIGSRNVRGMDADKFAAYRAKEAERLALVQQLW